MSSESTSCPGKMPTEPVTTTSSVSTCAKAMRARLNNAASPSVLQDLTDLVAI
jgi:hypothetical protein